MRKFEFCTAFFLASSAFAQGGPAPGSSTTPAVQLPLSGRNGQGGSVSAAQTPVPGTTSSVNTLNTTVQAQGPYAGSTLSRVPFSGKLSLREAVRRGLEYNLGAVGLNNAVRQSMGQQRVARSSLLPNLNGALRETVQQTNLRAMGIRVQLPFPGVAFPTIVGPFNYFDLRATLTQTVADMTALNNYRSAQEVARANRHTAEDARDLVVLAVGGAYLQAIAARARVASAHAQLETATALYGQTVERRQSGLLAQIDVNRSLVQRQTQQQRVATLENDFAKQKINLARLTGLPPNDNYELTDEVPFTAAPPITEEDALKRALESRADLKAAVAQARASNRARSAARAERLPSLALSADYGAIGTNPAQSHGTFAVTGTLRFPIWQGGRAEGDIEQAEASLDQRRAEVEDMRGRVESDVRDAFLDLRAASSQVEVSLNNRKVARETLDLTRQRYEAGITDSLEVVQADEGVASADLDYITSLFAHNLAKLSLARAIGHAEGNLPLFLKLQ
ncbi:MAG: TolC family protein [Acidobacteriota bacterium]|nr:TolC family protein [Acidobacteriota bacterium]